MIGKRERNRLLLELWDAFHRKGCPVCGCAGERVLQAIRQGPDGEPGENAVVLCRSHTRILASGRDGCGSDAALRFLRRVETRLREVLERRRGRPGALGFVKTVLTGRDGPYLESDPSACSACRLERREERKTLAVLVDALTDPDFHRAFRESDGLCLRHLDALARRAPGGATADTVLREQLRKLEDLRDAFAASRFQPDRAGVPDDPAVWERLLVLLGAGTGQGPDAEAVSPPTSGEGAGSSSGERTDEQDDFDDGFGTEQFEQEKWRRAREMLQRRLSEESSRAAALHYRYWKAMEDNKTLQMNLAGARAMARSVQEQLDRLKAEIATPQSKGRSNRTGGA